MAGITPDPKKRDYLLPPGCKDLIDVLQPRRGNNPHLSGVRPRFTRSRGGEDNGGFADIEKYMAMVFESRAFMFTLRVNPPGQPLAICVSRFLDGAMSAKVWVQMNTVQETATRGFYLRHKLPIPEDTAVPAEFFPDLPVEISFDILPIPPDAPRLARLAADLFQDVCGLSDEAILSFRYDETKEAT